MESEARSLLLQLNDCEADLKTLLPATYNQICQERKTLEARLELPSRIKVGFLGESQVGKSSVINAIIGTRLLPSGGIGPLTALATEMQYGVNPEFKVVYDGKKRLADAKLILQRAEEAAKNQFDDDLCAKREFTVSQIRLLFKSDQHSETIDEARASALLGQILEERDPIGADFFSNRIREIRKLLNQEELVYSNSCTASEFLMQLRERAAGWRSPLIKKLFVTTNLDILKRLEITDLPGIGVVGDAGRSAAEQFITRHANAIVLVIRNNGVTESLVRLFQQARIIERFNWQENAQTMPLQISIVVTHVDNIARERYAEKVRELGPGHPNLPTKEELFLTIADAQSRFIREQFRQALFEHIAPIISTFQNEDDKKRYSTNVGQLCERLNISCVIATDYLGFKENYTDDNFIKNDINATNIRSLQESLSKLADEAIATKQASIKDSYTRLRKIISESLDLADSTLGNEDFLANNRLDQLKTFYQETVVPFQNSLEQKTQHFGNTISQRLNESVRIVTKSAQLRGIESLNKISNEAGGWHWKTLNAALVRNGRYSGSTGVIDFPGAISSTFEALIAENLSKLVISPMENEFFSLASEISESFDVFCRGILAGKYPEQIYRSVQQINGLIEEIKKHQLSWSEEETIEISERVRDAIYDIVEGPIAANCERAIDLHLNVGTGTKERILETFRQGCGEALELATANLERLLISELDNLKEGMKQQIIETYLPLMSQFNHLIKTLEESSIDEIRSSARKTRELILALRKKILGVELLAA